MPLLNEPDVTESAFDPDLSENSEPSVGCHDHRRALIDAHADELWPVEHSREQPVAPAACEEVLIVGGGAARGGCRSAG